MNLLAIGLDYLMLQKDKVRGDVRKRQLDYAKLLGQYHQIVYCPRELNLKEEKWADNLWIYPTNSRNKNTFIFDAIKIANRICKENKIDAVTTEDPFTTAIAGWFLKRKYKLPLNVQVHNDFCDNGYWIRLRKINRLFNHLGKFTLKRADTIRVGTDYEKTKLADNLNIARNSIHVIPVNCEIERFSKADGTGIRNRYLNSKFDKILLFTGRLVQQKGLADLLKALKIIVEKKPKTLLLIAGKGQEKEILESHCRNLKLQDNVIFTGSIGYKEIPEYIAACDVYTIFSLFEGTCIAMAEAMAAARPVVASRFAGAIDLISNGNTGFIVNQHDHASFAKNVLYLLDTPEKAKEMGQRAAEFIFKKFENNKNINAMIKLWEKTAGMVVGRE